MRRAPTLDRLVCLGLMAYGLGGCSGKRVRLGDARLDPGTADSGIAGRSDEPDDGGLVDVSSSATTTADDFGTGTTEGNPSTPPDADAGPECTRDGYTPDQVVWIGDSWFTIPGIQKTRVEELARSGGALAEGESYENRAAAASDLAAIVQQYDASKAGNPPRVLIMDGGTWDTIVSNGSPSTVARVIVDFNAFLERVAAEGLVEQIIYMLVPELPQIPGVAELRPGLMEACGNSAAPCHFLDLQPLWDGHPEYTSMPDGIQASALGATVIAEEIWSIMRRECIAQ